jgi:hypothetical protein
MNTPVWLVSEYEGGGGDARYHLGIFTSQRFADALVAMQKDRAAEEFRLDDIRAAPALWNEKGEPTR